MALSKKNPIMDLVFVEGCQGQGVFNEGLCMVPLILLVMINGAKCATQVG